MQGSLLGRMVRFGEGNVCSVFRKCLVDPNGRVGAMFEGHVEDCGHSQRLCHTSFVELLDASAISFAVDLLLQVHKSTQI